MYVGLVKYRLKKGPDEMFRIGHHPTDNFKRISDWKSSTEKLPHVIECRVYELIK